MDRRQIQTGDIRNALQNLSNGDIKKLLGLYQRTMIKRDIGYDDLEEKTEEHHRDNFFHWILLDSVFLDAAIEFAVTKVGN